MKTLDFSTEHNEYQYSDLAGVVYLKNNKERYKNKGFLHEFAEYESKFNEEYFKKYLGQNGCKQLILNVTDACNLRCKYCYFYSDTYSYAPKMCNKSMSVYTAYKAIDVYLDYHKNRLKKNKKASGAITFYGGEPLLQFELIKNCIAYASKIDLSLSFHLTTNGTIMNDEILSFFVEHNVHVTISLDGPKEEHDRNRITCNQVGTYDIVIKNINYIKEKYPAYFNTYIQCNAVYDWNTDLYRVKGFYNSKISPRLITMSMVSPFDTSYYHKFNDNELRNFNARLLDLQKVYIENLKNKNHDLFLDKLFGTTLDILLRHANRFNDVFPFAVNCMPGTKI